MQRARIRFATWICLTTAVACGTSTVANMSGSNGQPDGGTDGATSGDATSSGDASSTDDAPSTGPISYVELSQLTTPGNPAISQTAQISFQLGGGDQPLCGTKIDGCVLIDQPYACHETDADNGCAPDEYCVYASDCTSVCQSSVSLQGGSVTLAGDALPTPITIASPYDLYNGPAPLFVFDHQVQVDSTGANPGFGAFHETFTTTTDLVMTPTLDQLDRNAIFRSSADLNLVWTPGSGRIRIDLGSVDRTGASCLVDDNGSFTITRNLLNHILDATSDSPFPVQISRFQTDIRSVTLTGTLADGGALPSTGRLELLSQTTQSVTLTCAGDAGTCL